MAGYSANPRPPTDPYPAKGKPGNALQVEDEDSCFLNLSYALVSSILRGNMRHDELKKIVLTNSSNSCVC